MGQEVGSNKKATCNFLQMALWAVMCRAIFMRVDVCAGYFYPDKITG